MRDEDKTKEQLIEELSKLRLQLYDPKAAKVDYDPLTGLPNRVILFDRLSQVLIHVRRNNAGIVAVMFLSLDNLKLINDNFGRDVGDQLLKEGSERLRNCLRMSDTIARPGRDEFMILLAEISHPGDEITVAEKIMNAFESPFIIDNSEMFINAKIGISRYPDDGFDADTLIKHSYTALNNSKKEKGNNYKFFLPAMEAKAFERHAMENNLRLALKRNELVLHYQPQVCLKTEQITGMEALIRWQHPEFGLVSPSEFIPLAEETGLIVAIGDWVLYTACEQQKAWQKAGIAPERIAVNMSAQQFRQRHIIENIQKVLKETCLDPNSLEIELTESLIFHNEAENISKLLKLRDMGMHISIDDFGSGHSSFNYLKQFPINRLKIVGSFVNLISTNHIDSAIAKLIIDLAHLLSLKVVAEEVETDDQLKLLQTYGCDEGQGFLFSRPLPIESAVKTLSQKTFIYR